MINVEEKRNAAWQWTSGQPYSNYNKWQPNEPSGTTAFKYVCGVMAKEWPSKYYGHFKDINCFLDFPYICEYEEST